MSDPTIEDHWLCWDDPHVELRKEQERMSANIMPKVIVIHYGVTHSLDALVAAQRARGYWAHLSIDGYIDGEHGTGSVYEVFQSMPFNMRGSHAGKSSYRGVKRVNDFSIGVEISNPGPLVRNDVGDLVTTYGKYWPEEEAVGANHHNGPASWKHWAAYTNQEIDILVGVCHALRQAYPSIEDIVGHDEISPGRKFDPGPAFPMSWLRDQIFGDPEEDEG